jgi:hypothetical protein
MSFGRNPHVAKAEAAEQKARSAKDGLARAQAWRESAHFWQRASDRETDPKRKQEYLDRADGARAAADSPDLESDTSETPDSTSRTPRGAKPTMLN